MTGPASSPLPGPLLMRTSGWIESLYVAVAAREGITVQQSRILVHVWRRPSKMGAIGAEYRLGKTTMTGIIARMEDLGLVVRTPDPADRRGLVVAPTKKGAAAADRVVDTLRAQVLEVLEVLDEEDQRTLHRILGRVVEAINGRP